MDPAEPKPWLKVQRDGLGGVLKEVSVRKRTLARLPS
jgi:hypothetical protein